MSINITQNIVITKTYGALGSLMDEAGSDIPVSYSAQRLIDFDGQVATAEFSITIDEKITGQSYKLSYQYSGEGNPLDQAEQALEDYFKKQIEG